MMSLNRAQIIGNVTRDPEVRTTTSGQSVANFSVATNAQWTDAQGQKQERTEFHNIVAWGKLGEICGQYLVKGRRVYVEGRLQTRDWETQDGQKRRTTEIVADNMIMLDRPSEPSSGGQVAPQPIEATAPAAAGAPVADKVVEKAMGEEEIKVEDIPF
jgi:single-strand DNA-binding protein